MNNNDFYERRDDRALLPPEPRQPEHEAASALAIHRDPSLAAASDTAPHEPGEGSVAWVRPSEMPALLGSKVGRRGIDLQSELARRARRTPAMAARVSRRAIARPDNAPSVTTSAEELGL